MILDADPMAAMEDMAEKITELEERLEKLEGDRATLKPSELAYLVKLFDGSFRTIGELNKHLAVGRKLAAVLRSAGYDIDAAIRAALEGEGGAK